ncbi:MAG: hypothetical protein J2P58_01810 [Acidimicrobiaceae bacterium]|nr:hypothetical protein [Acidimicrobiaceae bacterium]
MNNPIPTWRQGPPAPPSIAACPAPSLLEELDPDMRVLLNTFDTRRDTCSIANDALDGTRDFRAALGTPDPGAAIAALAADEPNRLGRAWAAHQAALIAHRKAVDHAKGVTYKRSYDRLMDLETQLLEQVGKVTNFTKPTEADQLALSQVRHRIAAEWRPLQAMLLWCAQPHRTVTLGGNELGSPEWWRDIERKLAGQPEPIPASRMDASLGIASRKRITATPTSPSGDRRNRRVGYP